jgi:5-(carboxyamino)imidazole ribonucleotide synthase
MILPGQTIGVLGGGELGRMLVQAAQRLGYGTHVFEPLEGSPAGRVAEREINASFEDLSALTDFGRECDVVTYASENIPAAPLAVMGPLVPLVPGVQVLRLCQNRQRMKAWLRTHGFPQPAWIEALDGDINPAVDQVRLPCVVKTADFSRDGKGQMKLTDAADVEQAAAIFRGRRCVLERWCDSACEVSVIVARSRTGGMRTFPVAENLYVQNVLEFSLVPARVPEPIAATAVRLAIAIAEKLAITGLLAVEFFVTRENEVLVNEFVPRPHNSGHWSIDGAETSQFEQHVRAICALPLGETTARQPTVMANILGDAWRGRDNNWRQPDWAVILGAPGARLHLYGTAAPRAGRKMGHFTLGDISLDVALAKARELKSRL